MDKCIFCKIINKEIPKELVYEDEDIVAFPDIHPIKPVHLLVMPKQHITDFSALHDDSLTVKLRNVIQKLGKDNNLDEKGYRLIINGGGAQGVDHLHIHLTGPWGKAAEL